MGESEEFCDGKTQLTARDDYNGVRRECVCDAIIRQWELMRPESFMFMIESFVLRGECWLCRHDLHNAQLRRQLCYQNA